ncbi:MAG: M20/M25/M40 family metallo-hydrolase [Clostridiales bacterium]|nr:M20/M25/M40 family metallo-hydrolase [Clostridiales bacterium]
MSEFLAPLNYDRARDVLRRLSVYNAYHATGAMAATAVLKESYPLIFSQMEVKTFENEALLFEMLGANMMEPLVFTSHLDAQVSQALVLDAPIHELPMSVPISRAHIISLFEALEELLRDGYRPGGDLFIALSMDGLSGGAGAKSLAAHLKARSVSPCFVLDYGGYVTMDAFRTYLPKESPLALVGITEKGLLNGKVTADTSLRSREGCEQMMPLAELLRGGARLTRHPKQAALCNASQQMLCALGTSAPFLQRMLVSKPQRTFPLLKFLWRKRAIMRQFFFSELTVYSAEGKGTAQSPCENASLEFTQSIIPGKKTAEYKYRIRKMLKNDDLKLEYMMEGDSSVRSEPSGEAWDALETAIEIQFERVVIVPCLSPFVTDGRYYAPLGGRVYRFSPFMVTGDEGLHGECTVTDGTLQTAVQFFRSMLSV